MPSSCHFFSTSGLLTCCFLLLLHFVAPLLSGGVCHTGAAILISSPLNSMLMLALQRALAAPNVDSEGRRLMLVWRKFNELLWELPWRSHHFARPVLIADPAITILASIAQTWLYARLVVAVGSAVDAKTIRQKLFVSLTTQAVVAVAFYPLFTLGRRALFSTVSTSPAVLIPAAGWTALYAGLGAELLRRSVFMAAKWVVVEYFQGF